MNLTDSEQFEQEYLQYIYDFCPHLDPDSLNRIKKDLAHTSWETPTSSIDFNNLGVLSLIHAEMSSNLAERQLYLHLALDVLHQGIEIDNNPFCVAHLAILLALTGQFNESMSLAFSNLMNQISLSSSPLEFSPTGLIYIPQGGSRFPYARQEILTKILTAKKGYQSSLILLGNALIWSQLIFYNDQALRLLNFVAKIIPDTVFINLKLGISHLVNHQTEGLFYLHQCQNLVEDSPEILQALYISYRDLIMNQAEIWLNFGRICAKNSPNDIHWKWTELELNSPFTYIPFEQKIILAVESSFHSFVTGVLMAEGDWFEEEMEFWRTFIQPGMTVIDVGANVGVYTFSAALRVGDQGCVIAVEPFSNCVNCLQETRRINQLDWVKIYPKAASNHQGKARLYLHSANELNEIIPESEQKMLDENAVFQEVNCFPLDHLILSEKLTQVDILKIDAEGHELLVLSGSESILSQFSPVIIYENIEGKKQNQNVAPYLQSRGYRLFLYQPYWQDLTPLNSPQDSEGKFNIIALPEGHYLLQ